MYIVTGVSRGLGKATVDQLLEKGEKVLGIGRNTVVNHSNYTFISCDLSDSNEVSKLHITIPQEPITLINNAGIIGEIKRISDQKEFDLPKVLQVNTVAPMAIAKMIYLQLNNKNDFTLVNISSGAANRAISSWSAYCASKAALNMLTETFYLEELEKGNSPKIYAVSPGVIDTDMQQQIRSTTPENFSALNNFVQLKEENQLFSPEAAASKLLNKLNTTEYTGVFFDLRNV